MNIKTDRTLLLSMAALGALGFIGAALALATGNAGRGIAYSILAIAGAAVILLARLSR